MSLARLKRVAVVGSGPCGFYAADRLLRQPWISVDMFEKLPTPFGLVRYGVAPDHPEVKLCVHKFQQVAEGGRFSFSGNVRVGADISAYELRRNYDAVLIATGADADRELGVPGETLTNVVGARAFVGWYNGHPSSMDLGVSLSNVDVATVFGNGNVALDVARVLLAPIDHLASTDITAASLAALSDSSVRRVELIGRRGPLEVAFTIKELREALALKNCRLVVPDADHVLSLINAGEKSWSAQRPRKRLIELLRTAVRDSQRPLNGAATPPRELVLRFLTSPTSFDGDKQGRVAVAHTSLNKLAADGRLVNDAQPTAGDSIKCELAVRSIGYRATPIDGFPFDDASSKVRATEQGRLLASKDAVMRGVYAAGWARTGPTGVIATTMSEAHAIADTVVEDLQAESPSALDDEEEAREPHSVKKLLSDRGVRVVSFAAWGKIDEEEVKRGAAVGKPREKITNVDEMLRVAGV